MDDRTVKSQLRRPKSDMARFMVGDMVERRARGSIVKDCVPCSGFRRPTDLERATGEFLVPLVSSLVWWCCRPSSNLTGERLATLDLENCRWGDAYSSPANESSPAAVVFCSTEKSHKLR